MKKTYRITLDVAVETDFEYGDDPEGESWLRQQLAQGFLLYVKGDYGDFLGEEVTTVSIEDQT